MNPKIERFSDIFRDLFIFASIAFFLFFFDRAGLAQGLRGGLERGLLASSGLVESSAYMAMTPLRMAQYWREGITHIADLERRLADASVERVRLEELEAENARMREELAVLPTPQREGGARIMSRPLTTGTQLVISGGEANGVKVGMYATDVSGVLVGRIERTGKYISYVRRPIDDGTVIAVRLSGRSTTGILRGTGTLAEITEVLQTDTMHVGDLVVTHGTDELYPPGMAIGQVFELTGKAADVTKGATIQILGSTEGNLFINE